MESRQAVLSVLEQASSQDPAQVALAEESLRTWETRPMFHATVFDIFADRSLPTNIRWLAIINLKNGIDKYWKKTAQYPIHIKEKELIRPRLLDYFDEQNPQIAVQYCVTISRISRWEFPRVWPEFIDVLMAHIGEIISNSNSSPASQHQTMEHNALYTLHLFIKSLCQRTLTAERQAFKRLAPMVFRALAPVYDQRIAQFNHALNNGLPESQSLLKSIRLCIKVLRRLLVFGFENIQQADPAVQEFYTATTDHQPAFYSLFATLSADARESSDGLLLRKIVLLYGKMYLEFQKYHPVHFITMECVKKVLEWYWMQILSEAPKMISSPTDPDSAPELVLSPLLIQGLELYKNVVKNFFYAIDDDNTEPDSDAKRCRQVIDGQILVPSFVSQMAETLINYYIPLKAKDLEMWQDDPETWMVEEDSDYWSFDVRRSAERLFVDVVDQQRAQTVQQLVHMLWHSTNNANGSDASFFQREGLYAALGLCTNQLYDSMDFCSWLKQHPVVDSPMSVVKWRVAWLIGKWVPVKFPVEERGYAYSVLLQLARREEPLVVRMEALASLSLCVDDWDFDAEQFKPYLQPSIEVMTGVLSDVTMAESRMKIVNFMSALVCRMQREIMPFAETILHLIPPLWQSALQENLYQTTILSLVTKLVEALGVHSTAIQPFVAPLVQHSIDLSDQAHIYLIEDGLELWLALIRNCSALDPSISGLVQSIPGLLQYSTETLKKVLKITESYILVNGDAVFAEHGSMLLRGLHGLVSDSSLAVRATAAGYVTLNVIVQCMPLDICQRPLIESNLLWTAFTRIVERKEAAIVLVHHAGFLARVAVHYPSLFAEFLASQEALLAKTFVENWVDLYDDVGQVTQRRLHAIAFAAAIATANDGVLHSLPLMVPIWNDIMSNTGSSQLYFSDVDDDLPDDFGEVVAENHRRQKMLSNDPSHKFDIKHVLTQSMAECERLNGAVRFQEIIARVDSTDLEDLRNQLS
ncbi:hypothetical protein GGF39_003138 [Coemansia sp. RSA 1721]|nr:hypothetical protein GGF39_003138 [Coemansia sp. RSA 1721]